LLLGTGDNEQQSNEEKVVFGI